MDTFGLVLFQMVSFIADNEGNFLKISVKVSLETIEKLVEIILGRSVENLDTVEYTVSQLNIASFAALIVHSQMLTLGLAYIYE